MYSIFYSLAELFFIFNCRHLWYAAFQQLLLVVFSLLPVELQELSYSVKGYLLKGEKPCGAGRKDTDCNCNRRRGTPNNSANACLLLFTWVLHSLQSLL